MKASKLSFALAALLCVGVVRAENWSQWRGPNLNGSSSETNLPDSLDPQKNLAWQLQLPGVGNNTPVVHGDRIFVSSLDKASKNLVALCVDRKSGKIAWQKQAGIDPTTNRNNNLTGPSAVTDGKQVIFYFGSGDLVCFDMEGNVKWSRNLQKDFGQFNVLWLYASSPLLHKDRLYIQVLHRNVSPNKWDPPSQGEKLAESYVLCVNAADGKDVWRNVRPTEARAESQESYATPMPWESNGKTELIIVGGDAVTGHDMETGKELWRAGDWNPERITHWRLVPSPVIADGLAIVCAPKRGPVIAVKPGGSGDVTRTHTAWKTDKATSDVPVPLVYKGNLYVLDGDFKKGISCMVPSTGEVKWFAPLESRRVFRASPTGADNKIYCMNEGGETWVLSAEDGKVLHKGQLEGEGAARATIVPSQGQVFVRTGDKLYCFEKK